MKKLICLFACFALIIGILSACGDKNTDDTTTDTTVTEAVTQNTVAERKVTLGYYKGKSLNPFKTESPANKNLMTLVYDSLFLPIDAYMVEPLMVLSYTNKDKMLTVTLNTEALFSDGTPIKPSDVVYSFSLAKESNNYKGRLSNFSSVAAGVDSVTFTLVSPDIYAENCLTFPIVKYGTGDNDIPTGSGRYTIAKKSGTYRLTANEYSTRLEEMATAQITLVPITSDAGELYLLQTGDLTYFFDDLSDGEYTKIRANTARVPMNNMVYLGINGDTVKNKKVKEALCYAINKTSLADTAYSGIAKLSDVPFNPTWEVISNIDTVFYDYNSLKAEEILEDAGYVYAYNGNQYRSKNFDYLEMTMLVNNENKPKEEMAKMTAEEINDIIVRDLYEDAYERQLAAPKKYKSKKRAEGLENLLFLCPVCGGIDTIHTYRNNAECSACEHLFTYNEYGMLEGTSQSTVRELAAWQRNTLSELAWQDGFLLSVPEAVLQTVTNHEEQILAKGQASLNKEALTCGDVIIPLADIVDMALHGRRNLVFSTADNYYELRPAAGLNGLKLLWLYEEYKAAATQ